MVDTQGKPRIVVADDHQAMRDMIVELLRRNGFDVVAEVQDGNEAVHAVIDLAPDLVILDISMPHVNGLAAGREIRRAGLRTKILFLTIQSGPEYVEVACGLGAAYVAKSHLYSDG